MTVPVQSLSDCRSLAELTDAARGALGECAREVQFRKHERLIPLGQPPQRLLVLTQGLAKVVGVSIDGHERILNLYRPADMVGAAVLMDGLQNSHEVAAMSGVRALAIGRRDLLILSRAHPSLIMALAREVSRQLVAMTGRVMAATSADVPVRLSETLLEFAGRAGSDQEAFVPLTYCLTHETMAQMIGASRPHVSTVLRDLESCGAVQRRSGNGLLVRPFRLRAIVDQGSLALSA